MIFLCFFDFFFCFSSFWLFFFVSSNVDRIIFGIVMLAGFFCWIFLFFWFCVLDGCRDFFRLVSFLRDFFEFVMDLLLRDFIFMELLVTLEVGVEEIFLLRGRNSFFSFSNGFRVESFFLVFGRLFCTLFDLIFIFFFNNRTYFVKD